MKRLRPENDWLHDAVGKSLNDATYGDLAKMIDEFGKNNDHAYLDLVNAELKRRIRQEDRRKLINKGLGSVTYDEFAKMVDESDYDNDEENMNVVLAELSRRGERKDNEELVFEFSSESDEDSDDDYKPTKNELLIAELLTKARDQAGLNKIRFNRENGEAEVKQWSEKSLQGHMGELTFTRDAESDGRIVLDLNNVSLNFAGVDHLTDDETHPLQQSKLHISEKTANVDTYRRHADNAGDYAIKAVRDLLKHKEKISKQFNFKPDSVLGKLMKALDKLDGNSDDDIWGTDAHELAMKGMCFAVPADIFDKIPSKERGPFRRLEMSAADYREIMNELGEDYIPSKKPGSKRNPDDDDYKG